VKTVAFWAFGIGLVGLVWGAGPGPRLVPRTVGGVGVGVPDGWRVEANDRGLVAAEPSGAAYVIVSLLDAGSKPTPEAAAEAALASIGLDPREFRIVRRGEDASEAEGGDVRLGVVVGERVLVALAARSDAYGPLGGLDLARRVVKTPPSSGKGAGASSGLAGRWTYVGVGSLLDKFDSHGRWVGEASSGSGTTLEFRGDGTYAPYYYARVTSYSIVSEAKVVEAGRWSLDGSSLRLRPASRRGEYRVGTAPPAPVVPDLRERAYRVDALVGDALVLTGPCAPFQVDPWCYRNITDEHVDPTKVEAVTYRRDRGR